MSACWKSLAASPSVSLRIVAQGGRNSDKSDPVFSTDILHGLNCELYAESPSLERLAFVLKDFQADVVVVSGWYIPAYLKAIRQMLPLHARLVVCSDNPIQFTWRQRLAPLKIGWLRRRADLWVVPGERAFQLMKLWRVPDAKIKKGLYGIDATPLSAVAAARPHQWDQWPRRFAFVGRYNARKGIDILLKAYERYRQAVSDPWELLCCGRGELEPTLADRDGVVNVGFIQPNDLPAFLAKSSVFVLPSRHDAWPLAIVEACAAGMSVICTSTCGSSAELVRDEYNGMIVVPNDEMSLARALIRMHRRRPDLPEFGKRGEVLAGAYAADVWAIKWREMLNDLCEVSA